MKILLLISLFLLSSFPTIAQSSEFKELETTLPVKAATKWNKITNPNFKGCSGSFTQMYSYASGEVLAVFRIKFLFEDLDEKAFVIGKNVVGDFGLKIKSAEKSISQESDGKVSKKDNVILFFKTQEDAEKIFTLFKSAILKCKEPEVDVEKTKPKTKPKVKKKKKP